MLLAAADCGVPRWSGQAIQAVAPYGKTGSWAMYLVFASFLCKFLDLDQDRCCIMAQLDTISIYYLDLLGSTLLESILCYT